MLPINEFNILGQDLFGEPIVSDTNSRLKEQFIMSPFSILSARDGLWQERKRAWLALGIQSELGRKENTLKICMGEFGEKYGRETMSNVSVFDPVLCELIYRWFCPLGGQMLDPFAGGSVRGIVASKLGYKYWGCDLSEGQIKANRMQGNTICNGNKPIWVIGDSMDKLKDAPSSDFIFSCPPYGDLEIYSNDPRDLSNMEYHTFIASYKRIIMRACLHLKTDRFACFVVSDFRDKKTGNYRNFVSDTIGAFLEQGLYLYNEAILVTAVGSLPIRITKQFKASRKLGKTHQNILIFVKGDGKKATKNITSSRAEGRPDRFI
jgi:DNA modification methylase